MTTRLAAGALLAVAALAWVISGERMSGMDAGPGTDPGTLGFFLGVWVVMMAAMMFPSILPTVVAHARMQEGAPGATAIFVAGYLLAWTAAGLLGYAIFEIGRTLAGGLTSWDGAGPYLAGAVLATAAVYQLTQPKDACLRRCRSPSEFLARHRRPGRAGALRMGATHGAWCVGCCWALTASLFALGVMSLGWMAFIAALIAIERLLPRKELAIRGTALVLTALGLMVALAPGAVPGLTVPGSPAAMSGMEGGPEMDAMP
jgi:predicted metal-binding membrane protein